ncbi:hypothetical protein FQR65_LT13472 [Abscondita terminalis]|nr:hypothetical protein FQR65_LT13472 [Abscondita terminalis]
MFSDSPIFPSDDLKVEDDGDSEIQKFFSGAKILLTGGTGFMGRLLLEKLLRACRDIDTIYVIIRTKKNENVNERLKKMFEGCLFDKVRNRDGLKKIVTLNGDLTRENLGLSRDDLETLVEEVTCVFHMAATTRFNEHIRQATYINVRATWDLLELSRRMKKLRCFVHVSTAYSFCTRRVIDEVKYSSKIKAEHLINMVEALDDDELEKITPVLLGKWPNTYTFTKAVAEDIIIRKYSDLPLGIVRPSIVSPTAKEPLAGWSDTFGGLTALVTGRFLGVLHVVHGEMNRDVDSVPGDYATNNIIAVAWEVANKRLYRKRARARFNHPSSRCHQTPPIYNYVNSCQNPITFQKSYPIVKKIWEKVPSVKGYGYPFLIDTTNEYLYLVLHFVFHVCVSYGYDAINVISGKPPFAVKRYKTLNNQLNYLNYFMRNKWTFTNFNTQRLWKDLSLKDQELFNFDIGTLNWEDYMEPFTYGTRVYLLRDSMDTVPEGLKIWRRFKIVHYTIVTSLVVSFVMFLYMLLRRFML